VARAPANCARSIGSRTRDASGLPATGDIDQLHPRGLRCPRPTRPQLRQPARASASPTSGSRVASSSSVRGGLRRTAPASNASRADSRRITMGAKARAAHRSAPRLASSSREMNADSTSTTTARADEVAPAETLPARPAGPGFARSRLPRRAVAPRRGAASASGMRAITRSSAARRSSARSPAARAAAPAPGARSRGPLLAAPRRRPCSQSTSSGSAGTEQSPHQLGARVLPLVVAEPAAASNSWALMRSSPGGHLR